MSDDAQRAQAIRDEIDAIDVRRAALMAEHHALCFDDSPLTEVQLAHGRKIAERIEADAAHARASSASYQDTEARRLLAELVVALESVDADEYVSIADDHRREHRYSVALDRAKSYLAAAPPPVAPEPAAQPQRVARIGMPELVEVECWRCVGSGQLPHRGPCWSCNGVGRGMVRASPPAAQPQRERTTPARSYKDAIADVCAWLRDHEQYDVLPRELANAIERGEMFPRAAKDTP